MRRAIHNLAYAVVNSSAMQGMVPGSVQHTEESPVVGIIVRGVDVAVAAALVAGGVALIVRRTKAEREHPELYKRSKRKQAKLDRKLAEKAAGDKSASEKDAGEKG
jgi:beta-glucosidase